MSRDLMIFLNKIERDCSIFGALLCLFIMNSQLR